MTIELYKNSFVTLEEAQAYFDERYDSSAWLELESTVQEQLLITASKKINLFDFVGSPLVESQPMAFPRDFAMPQDIKDAACEEAIALIQKEQSVHLKNQQENISSISLGAGSVSYAGTTSHSDEAKLLASSTALYLVKKWIKKGYNIPY